MKISTKGRYALRVMIDLAEQNSDEYIPLKAIAKRQEISEKYLESIIVVLSKAGFVDGMRGKGGGYKLTRPAEGYTVGSNGRRLDSHGRWRRLCDLTKKRRCFGASFLLDGMRLSAYNADEWFIRPFQ